MRTILLIFTTTVFAAAASIAPPRSFSGGWQAKGEGQHFPADRLYEYMDGAAELFLEMGCRQLQVQNYQRKEEELSLEIFEMVDLPAANGIFLWQPGETNSLKNPPVPGKFNPYQISFHANRYFVRISNFSGDSSLFAAMLTLSRVIYRQIAPTGSFDLSRYLPQQGRIAGSLRVVRGPISARLFLGCAVDLSFLKLGRNAFAVAARYRAPAETWRMNVFYQTEQQAKEIFNSILVQAGTSATSRHSTRIFFPPFNLTVSLQGNRLNLTFTKITKKANKPVIR